MPNRPLRLLAPALAALVLLGAPALADDLKLSNKWRVEVSEGASSDGLIKFRVTGKQGTPVDVTVAVEKGRGENDIAADIRDAFRAVLDQDVYSAEKDDGEDVLLKKHKGPDFELKLVESTVKGTRINVEKE